MERSARNPVALLLASTAAALLMIATLAPERAHAETIVRAPMHAHAQTHARAHTHAHPPTGIRFRPCPGSNDLACGHLAVPVDPSNPSGGAIRLAIRRRRAPVGHGRTAVIALAGGPGQAAIPFASTFEQVLGPILDTRDLIVYDQRGTGTSHPLRCRALEKRHVGPAGPAVRRCGNQIGADRGDFTSADSVADIEAIRLAGGYEKLVLYGTSYGTRVALDYAQRHPGNVEALILDSVVAPNGPETLDLPTFAAVPRILRQLCDYDECRGITHDPVGDLRRLVARLGDGSLAARVIDRSGRARRVHVGSEQLLNVLVDGDLNPLLRAEFPAAVKSALLGDTAALGRLVQRTGGEGGGEGIDVPLFYATSCEEQLFPWSRASGPSGRFQEAVKRIDALPRRSFSPFARRNVLLASDIRECADWPFPTPAPAVDTSALPDVPTVILSGADDVRTPTAGARAVAAKIPDSHVIVVPNTGHSVLTTEFGDCALKAVHAMFEKMPVHDCKPKRPPGFVRPAPIAPRRLATLPSLHGYHGAPGRTLTAVGLTLTDVVRQLLIRLFEGADARSLAIGGLRGGTARLSGGAIGLHDYSYVPGVTLSGRLSSGHAQLIVGGRTAAHGELRLSRTGALVGRLDDTTVRLGLPRAEAGVAKSASAGRERSRLVSRALLAGAGLSASAGAIVTLDRALTDVRPSATSLLSGALHDLGARGPAPEAPALGG